MITVTKPWAFVAWQNYSPEPGEDGRGSIAKPKTAPKRQDPFPWPYLPPTRMGEIAAEEGRRMVG